MSTDLLEDDRKGAILSDDGGGPDGQGKYRYRLWRTWDTGLPTAAFVMLNPSTADATADDQTLRRCIDFAKRWGYGRVELGNLFAYRASEPSELWNRTDIVGPENDRYLREMLTGDVLPVAAWGAYGDKLGRASDVSARFDVDWVCLGTTHSGQPRHPLYLPADTSPEPWEASER